MLDGDITDQVEAMALSRKRNHIDIYSASWGPDDDGVTVDGPATLTRKAFVDGVTKVSLHPSVRQAHSRNCKRFSTLLCL